MGILGAISTFPISTVPISYSETQKVIGTIQIHEVGDDSLSVSSSNFVSILLSSAEPILNDSFVSTANSFVGVNLLISEAVYDQISSVGVVSIQGYSNSIEITTDIFAANVDPIVSANFNRTEPNTPDVFAANVDPIVSVSFNRTEPAIPDVFVSNILVPILINFNGSEIGIDTISILSKTNITSNLLLIESLIDSISLNVSIRIQSQIVLIEQNIDSIQASLNNKIEGLLSHSETNIDDFNFNGFLEQVGIPYNLYTSNVTLTSAVFHWTKPE